MSDQLLKGGLEESKCAALALTAKGKVKSALATDRCGHAEATERLHREGATEAN